MLLMAGALRRGELCALRMSDLTFDREGQPKILTVLIRAEATKTGQRKPFQLSGASLALVRDYISKWRQLIAPSGSIDLFPGRGLTPMDAGSLANKLQQRIKNDLGWTFNVHLVRGFAALAYLENHPGDFPHLMKILGHRRVDTLITHYAWIDEADAFRRHQNNVFGDGTDRRQPPRRGDGRGGRR